MSRTIREAKLTDIPDIMKVMEMVGEQLAGKGIRELGLSQPKICYNFLEGFTVS